MLLKDIQCKNAKPKEKSYKLSDGTGLYLLVTDKGTKSWRYNFRINGKQATQTYGKYPEISLLEARESHAKVHKMVSAGIDPRQHSQEEKLTKRLEANNTFENIAREWHEHKQSEWSKEYALTIINRLEADVFGMIGKIPIKEITPPIMLEMFRKIESRGVFETTRRVHQYCGQIFRYAVITGKADRDPSSDIKGALKSKKVQHHAAIQPNEIADLLQALNANEARMYKPTQLAVKMMLLTFVRTSELINARWEEFDLEDRVWIIPATRMKMEKAHIVPLSTQSIGIIEEISKFNGKREWVFASHVRPRVPMSNNTILSALYRMGYKGKMTGHGFRALALTTLQEKLGYPFEVADLQLAHAKRHSLGEAYDRAQFLERRKQMMQDWGDYMERQGLQ